MSTNTIIGAIVVIIVLIGGYFIFSQPAKAPVTESAIKIGFIGALTGDGASYGEPQQRVIQLAVDEVNKNGGFDGKQVEVVYEDAKCTGEGGANAAQKLVNVDKVQIILGGTCSGETLAAVPVAEAGKVAIVTGSATSPDLIGKSPYFFRVYPNDSVQGQVLAQGAWDRGWKKIAVIQESTDYPLGIYKAFAATYEPLGGTLTKDEFKTDTTDFRSVLSKIKALKPDAVFVDTQTVASASRIFTQIDALGWKPQLIVNDVTSGDPVTLMANKKILEGALGADFVLNLDNPKLKKLTEVYKATYGDDLRYPTYSSAVYDSFYIALDAIKAVGYDGTKIAAWGHSSIQNWDGASGMITVGANGERQAGHSLMIIKDAKETVAK